jgi:arylsulfatase A-like enzyme
MKCPAILLVAGLLLVATCGRQEDAPRPMSRREAFERRKAREGVQPVTVAAAPAPCPAKPNILIITLDTLRFDATSLAPNPTNRTPVLERLAASGVQFSRAYSTHDATPQSHASLFTGYVNVIGDPKLDRPEASIAHQLSRLGYQTFAVVANGNLSPKAFATTRPFDDDVNLDDLWLAMSDEKKAQLAPPLDARMSHYHSGSTDWYRMMVWASAEQILPRFERRIMRVRQPFLGFVNILDAHEPYLPDPRYYSGEPLEKKLRAEPPPAPRLRKPSEELTNPDSIVDEKRRAMIKAKLALTNGRPWSLTYDLDDAALKIYRMRYDAEVREVDRAVGRMMEMLDRAKLRDSTIIIITADHGESFGEEHFLTHAFHDGGDLEATQRVPMLILFPPCYHIAPARIDTLCTIADVTPTLYEILGIDASKLWVRARPGEVGRSLLPLIHARANPQNTPAQSESWKPVSPEESSKTNDEARKRLKALGYIQ